MGRITHREFLVREAWVEQQWNRPSRTDFYLMRVAQRVQQVLAKNPGNITLEHQRVEIERKPVKPKTQLTLEQQTVRSKAAWLGAVSSDKTRVTYRIKRPGE